MSENKVFDTILKRRSIRRFTEAPVERDKVSLMLQAAMAAPSACNLQPWEFVVVDDKDALERVKSATTQGQYNAPLAVVICGTYKHIPWDGDGWLFDLGAAAQNMMLEATELGLASVCVGGFEEDELSAALDLPCDVTPACVLEFGYPAYAREPMTWYAEDAVHYQRYDKDRKRKMRTLQDLQDDIAAGII